MRKRLLLQVSVATLVTFLIPGYALGREGEKLPQPWRLSPAGLGFYSFPAWSPEGGRIAYTAYQEGRQDIWVVELNEEGQPEGAPVNITNSPARDEHPSWSPCGERLVFHSDGEEGKRKLFIVDADGSNLRLLYQHRTERGLREGFHPAWSPRGGRIAFVAENNIWVIDEEGRERSRHITSFGYNDYPSWSPDGNWIVFSSGTTVSIIKADGSGEKKRLTGWGGMRSDFPGWSSHPSWSPDGERIVFVSNKKKTGEKREVKYYDLWIVKADGTGEAEYLTNDRYREYFPAWSPQGDKLAFQSNRKDGFHVWAVSLPQ